MDVAGHAQPLVYELKIPEDLLRAGKWYPEESLRGLFLQEAEMSYGLNGKKRPSRSNSRLL